jgi:hypothetical protein
VREALAHQAAVRVRLAAVALPVAEAGVAEVPAAVVRAAVGESIADFDCSPRVQSPIA